MLLVLVVMGHLVLDLLYRPFAYSEDFYDFGLKDSFTQITAVLGISLLIVLFEKDKTTTGRAGSVFIIVVPVIAMLLYEWLQSLIAPLSFDKQDLVYTIIGGFVCWMMQWKLVKL